MDRSTVRKYVLLRDECMIVASLASVAYFYRQYVLSRAETNERTHVHTHVATYLQGLTRHLLHPIAHFARLHGPFLLFCLLLLVIPFEFLVGHYLVLVVVDVRHGGARSRLLAPHAPYCRYSKLAIYDVSETDSSFQWTNGLLIRAMIDIGSS